VHIKFSRKDCKACPARVRCTREPRRSLTTRSARSRESSEEYRVDYARRAGIEGTISQGVRASGLRRARYAGLAKTHLHCLFTAAINILRFGTWLAEVNREGTRMSAFGKLMTAAVPA
jgi:transposase